MPRSDRSNAASRAARNELIGNRASVVASAHAPFVGIEGRVVDETARTFVLETDDGREVRIPKVGQRFAFETPDGRIEFDGSSLARNPIERLKS